MSGSPRRRDAAESAYVVSASFAQQRLWLLDRLLPTGSAYNIDEVVRLTGTLDVTALRRALNEVVRRHEALRTRFELDDGAPVQVITPQLVVNLEVEDLRTLPEAERETEVRRQTQAETSAPFTLAQGPLIRARLLRSGDVEHWLLLTLHHIVFDGWSSDILRHELTTLYGAYHRGEASPLPDLTVQYADYALWQRRWLQGAVLEKQLGFWCEALADLPILDLPTDRPRPAEASYGGGCVKFDVPESLTQSLKALSRREGATLFMTLLAAYQILLFRYSRQEDIIVGVPIAGRTRLEVEGLIGFFVNTLLLRGDLSGEPSFKMYLAQVRTRALDAYEHQDLPFEKLVEELAPKRDLSRNPLFQASLVLQNTPSKYWQLFGLDAQRVERIHSGTAKFELAMSLTESGGAIAGSLEYASDLFDVVTVGRMAGHFVRLLEGIAADPEHGIGHLPLLTPAERHQLLVEWNATAAEYPRDACIHQLFEQQVERTPDTTAVVCGEEQLTYRELNARANRLAHHLIRLGVGRETLVGICLESSVELIIGLLGILKAGGAYLPLDPSYPKERLAFMLEDSGASVLITRQALLAQLPRHDGGVVCLDRDWPRIDPNSDANPTAVTGADALAYVMYTSGSTGMPKGVMVPHRGITRLVCNTDYVQLDAGDCVAQVSNPSFDAATFEIWGALANGSRLAVVSREVALDPPRLADELRRRKISTLFLTTALFNEVVRSRPGAFAGIKQVLFGGEVVDARRVGECLRAGAPRRLLHVYGPTETVTFATWYLVEAHASGDQTIPIGRPVANTVIHVLDAHRQPVPVGVTGELYIGGDGVARGYWRRPELTAERFVPDPFSTNRTARLYRTGDLVRRLPDGNIVFLGRLDHQVKLRGFRVEPGEIEAALVRHAQVRDALVVLREDVPSEPRLVAYVVGQADGLATADLRAWLKQQLPDYMIPTAFVLLPTLPLTPNGKIDRRALPAPPSERDESKSDLIAPHDNVELHLAKIWEDLLKRERIGIRDNFFDVGGHSLLAVQLMDRIDQAFHRRLPLDTLWFRGGTVEALAQILRDESASGPDPELVLMKKGSCRPLFVVHTMGGNLFHYYDLARCLDAEQTVYGLQARGVYGTERPDHTIEAIATRCIESMRTVQPEGPYLVAGFSSGGVVAFELAQQLAAAGQRVALLALLDTYAPKARSLKSWIAELTVIRRRKVNLRHLQELAYFSVLHTLNLDRLRRLRTVGEAHRWAHWSYRPRPYLHPIEFFIVKDSADRAGAENLGWVRWTNDSVRIHRLPGSHGDLVKPPVVEELAARLQACIAAAADN